MPPFLSFVEKWYPMLCFTKKNVLCKKLHSSLLQSSTPQTINNAQSPMLHLFPAIWFLHADEDIIYLEADKSQEMAILLNHFNVRF